MSRQSIGPLPTRWRDLETTTRQCPECGGRLHCQYISRSAVVTLDGLLGLQLRVWRVKGG